MTTPLIPPNNSISVIKMNGTTSSCNEIVHQTSQSPGIPRSSPSSLASGSSSSVFSQTNSTSVIKMNTSQQHLQRSHSPSLVSSVTARVVEENHYNLFLVAATAAALHQKEVDDKAAAAAAAQQ